MKRVLGLSIGVVAVVVLGAAAMVVKPWNSGETESKASDLASVQRIGFEITTNATGELEAKDQIEIRSKLETQSTIVEVVAEGSLVSKGDVLVKLNTASIQEKIDEELVRVETARASVEEAENALKIQISENESRLRAGQMRVDIAELALKQWRDGDVVKKRKDLQLAIDQAQRQLKRLSDRFDRSEELLKEGFVSQNERDLDEIAFIDAQAKIETAKLDQQVYQTYQYPRDEKSKLNEVEEARAELDRIIKKNEINLSSKQSTLENRQRTYELRSGKLAKLQEQLELATIIAPSDGLVVYASSMQQNRWGWGGNEGPLQIGSNVRPNDLLMVLPDTSEMIASVRVHESLAGRIHPGLPVSVKIDATGGQVFQGKVDSIGVLAESGGWRDPNRREYTVRVALDATADQGVLKPSMRAEAVITLDTVDQALTIPVQSVFNDGPIRFVYVPKGAKYRRQPIALGQRSDVLAEITAGLDEGDRVLTREPDPSEIIQNDWEPKALLALGYSLDDEGNVMPSRRGHRGRGRGMAKASHTPKPKSQAVETDDHQSASEPQADASSNDDAETTTSPADQHPKPAETTSASAGTSSVDKD